MISKTIKLIKRILTFKPSITKCNTLTPDEVTYNTFVKSLSTVGYYCRYEGGICFSDLIAYNSANKSLIYVESDTPENQSCPSIYGISYESQTRLLTYSYYEKLCSLPAISIEEVITMTSQMTYSIVPKTWGDFMEEWI